MGSEKRQRQRENRMRAIAEAERSKKRSTIGRKLTRVMLAVAAVVLALLLWSVLSGDNSDENNSENIDEAAADAPAVEAFETDEPNEPASASDDSTPNNSNQADSDAVPDDATPDDAAPDEEDQAPDSEPSDSDDRVATDEPAPHRCPAEDGSDGPRNQLTQAPPNCIDPATLYTAAFDTNRGAFTLVLDPALDPVSVNNFIVLARWGAYDGTLFHRVIEDFMIQGGDVQLQSGTGGPGYQFTGEFPREDWYRPGALAMANRGNPASNGAQFFIITGLNGVGLPALYSPMGQVIEGLNVVCAIESTETDGSDAPFDEVVVDSVTITEATDAQASAYAETQEGERFVDGC